MKGFELCKLLRRQPLKKDGSGKQREKVTLRREKGALHMRKQSYKVVKGAKSLRRVAVYTKN